MNYQAILLAAGNSSRSGLKYNKILFELNGSPIIYLSAHNFILDDECSKLIIVCKSEDLSSLKKIFSGINKIVYVFGGNTRQNSVFNGLKCVDSEYVLIHDGARPYFSVDLLNRLKEKLKEVDAVIPVLSIKDTIKVVKNNQVVKTLKRDELKAVQTPQAFKTDVIINAHKKANNDEFTDDASIVETMTDTIVYTIDGEYANTKYTYKEDF